MGLVYLSFPLKKFYKENRNNNSVLLYLALTLLGFVPIIPFVGILGIYGFGCMLFASPIYVLNDEGIEEKDAWLDLKKYLQDFSNIKDKTTEMVAIWNYYLTYSMVVDLPSISKDEITSFFGWNIYNVQPQQNMRRDNEEYKIIKKLEHDKYPENLEEEIKIEREKYEISYR